MLNKVEKGNQDMQITLGVLRAIHMGLPPINPACKHGFYI